jgi:hypothetical protein
MRGWSTPVTYVPLISYMGYTEPLEAIASIESFVPESVSLLGDDATNCDYYGNNTARKARALYASAGQFPRASTRTCTHFQTTTYRVQTTYTLPDVEWLSIPIRRKLIALSPRVRELNVCTQLSQASPTQSDWSTGFIAQPLIWL